MSKVVHNREDVLGIVYMLDFLKDEYFPDVSVLEKSHYEEILSQMEGDFNIKLSKSTVIRICTFLRKPTPISYKSLDDFTYWCFDREIQGFKDLLKKRKFEIQSSNLISEAEIERILQKLSFAKSKSVAERPLTIELASTPFQLSLTEGNVANLLTSIAHCTGDILSEKFLNDPELLKSIVPDTRITSRVFVNQERRQENIENIVKKAIEFCREVESNSTTEIDPDWVADFFETAKDTSNEHMQYIWAKILANEVDKPGSFSRRAIHTVKLISYEEAGIFNLLSNCMWEIYPNETRAEKVLIKIPKDADLDNSVWGFDDSLIKLMVDLGLVYESTLPLAKDEKCAFRYFNHKHILEANNKNKSLDLVRLSSVGTELYNVVQLEKNIEYYEFISTYFDLL